MSTCEQLQRLLEKDGFIVRWFDNVKQLSREAGIVSYLLDIAMLEASSVFVGTGSSNLSRWVSAVTREHSDMQSTAHVSTTHVVQVNAIRGPKKLSMSLDVDWNTIHF